MYCISTPITISTLISYYYYNNNIFESLTIYWRENMSVEKERNDDNKFKTRDGYWLLERSRILNVLGKYLDIVGVLF